MKLASSAISLCGRQRATARRPVGLRRPASGRSLCGVVRPLLHLRAHVRRPTPLLLTLLTGCGAPAPGPAPYPCAQPAPPEPKAARTALSSYSGSFHLTIVATDGQRKGRSVQGRLELVPGMLSYTQHISFVPCEASAACSRTDTVPLGAGLRGVARLPAGALPFMAPVHTMTSATQELPVLALLGDDSLLGLWIGTKPDAGPRSRPAFSVVEAAPQGWRGWWHDAANEFSGGGGYFCAERIDDDAA